MTEWTFADDVAFLKEHTDIMELTAPTGGTVAVAPQYQGRVMTSAFGAESSQSFGWINRQFIASGAPDVHLNNYGGQDRFWLGPEAGQFGLWFAGGEPFTVEHWKTPQGFGAGAFEVVARGPASVTLTKSFEVSNYSQTLFKCAVERTVNVLGRAAAGRILGVEIGPDVRIVGFETVNTLTNAGRDAWRMETGLLSIWTLGQFKPLPAGKVIVPFKPGSQDELGPQATTDYFGPLPAERCSVHDDHLLLACDGQFRSKIGISPARAKDRAGSWDPDNEVLTIVQFNLPPNASQLPYVNSLWEIQDDPYAGDAVNSYNDGPPAAGAGQMGPFYEIETSSPAAALKPDQSCTHVHRTFHFAGPRRNLGHLARKLLGAGVEI